MRAAQGARPPAGLASAAPRRVQAELEVLEPVLEEDAGADERGEDADAGTPFGDAARASASAPVGSAAADWHADADATASPPPASRTIYSHCTPGHTSPSVPAGAPALRPSGSPAPQHAACSIRQHALAVAQVRRRGSAKTSQRPSRPTAPRPYWTLAQTNTARPRPRLDRSSQRPPLRRLQGKYRSGRPPTPLRRSEPVAAAARRVRRRQSCLRWLLRSRSLRSRPT